MRSLASFYEASVDMIRRELVSYAAVISNLANVSQTQSIEISSIARHLNHQRLKDAQKLYRFVLRSNNIISRDVENVWTYVQANPTTFSKLAVKLHHGVGHLTIEGEHDVIKGEVEEEMEERDQVEASVTPGPPTNTPLNFNTAAATSGDSKETATSGKLNTARRSQSRSRMRERRP